MKKSRLNHFVYALGICVTFTSVANAMPVPTWDQQINGSRRFEVLRRFSEEAVLDKETGLVWERVAGDTNGDQVVTLPDDELDWGSARMHCLEKVVGDRKGWRLPTIHELLSLIVPSVPDAQKLPERHPFIDVQDGNYWSATTHAGDPENAWVMDLFGNVLFGQIDPFAVAFVWCVRGTSPWPTDY